MKLLSFLGRHAPNATFAAIMFGILAGASYVLLIPTILESAQYYLTSAHAGEDSVVFFGVKISNYKFAVAFILLCALILVSRSVSQVLLSRIALTAAADLRTRVYERIAKTSVSDVEHIGESKIISAITTDITRIVAGAMQGPILLSSIVTIVGSLIYLLILNSDIFIIVICSVVIGIATYQLPVFFGRRYFARSRMLVELLHSRISSLVRGFKELKINAEKRQRYYFGTLFKIEKDVFVNTRRANTILTIASSYGTLISYFVIGMVLFVFVSKHAIAYDQVISVVLVLIYLSGPVALVLNSIPQFMFASVSLKNIERLFDHLPDERANEMVVPLKGWGSLKLCGVTYDYNRANGSFELGPIDLEFRRGEITFVVGGNGSGKTTLAKLIALHYAPKLGDIKFDQLVVNLESINSCRQCISTVFTDYHLFDSLLSPTSEAQTIQINHYLSLLRLDHCLTIQNGKYSTTALSDGQKKRLALLTSLLEDREIYIFDEWAADQEPSFKRFFYTDLLSELRSRNKIVIVISHDDRYFNLCDQLVVMEDGKIQRSERYITPKSPLEAADEKYTFSSA